MKTITLKSNGIELEQRESTCNFCGENKKECVKGSVPASFRIPKSECQFIPKKKLSVDDFGFHFWQNDLTLRLSVWDFTHNWVETGEYETKEIHSDICKDCIKQLANLTKEVV